MQAKKKNSTAITDNMWDAMAEEYEKGTWAGHGEISAGRPKLYDEEMATVSFRLPASRIAAVEAVVKARGESKSEFYRKAIEKELLSEAL